MSNPSSTRVEDGLLGTATLDDGGTVRVVRADGLDERELAEAAELLTAERSWPGFDVGVEPLEHLRWRLESPYGENPGYVTLLRHDDRLTNLEWATFRPFLLHGRGAVGAGAGRAALQASLDAGARAQLRNLRDLIDGQFDVQLRLHADAGEAGIDVHGPAFELGNHLVTRTRVLDRHRFAVDRAERHESHLPAPLIEASLLWPRAVAAIARRAAVVASDVRIERVERFDARIDELFVQAARPFALIGVRDAPYLNWRYCDERAGRHLPLVAFEGDSLTGFAVLRLTEGRAYLADLLTLPGRDDIVAALLDRVTEIARRAGAISIEAWLPSIHPHTETYKRLGFFSSHTGPTVIVHDHERGGRGALEFLRAPDAPVHLALGDSDRV